MDQWKAEGVDVYEPWVQGQLSWKTIVTPYLEHHIAWTHLWNLGLFEWCGQWDPMVQMTMQALIPALTAGFCVWALITVSVGWYWYCAVPVGSLMVFGTPLAYENILWGFQSQFGFLVALSLGGCAATALAWRTNRYIWLALLAGLAAPLAMGAGVTVGPVMIILAMLVMLAERKISSRSMAIAAVGALCLLWGLLLRSDSPPTQYAYAKSLTQWVQVWLAACAWPNSGFPGLAILACLPVVMLTFQILRKRVCPQPHEIFFSGIFIWAIACAAGGAWTRGNVSPTPPSRYIDFLALLCWVNLLALLLVLRSGWQQWSGAWRTLATVLTVAWFGSTLFGGIELVDHFINIDRPKWQKSSAQQFHEVNSLIAAAAVNSKSINSLQNRMDFEKVLYSQTMAPFLPPEIRMLFKGMTPENLLAIADTPSGWRWESGSFDMQSAAMIIFVRGSAAKFNLEILKQGRPTEWEFQPSGRHIGQWSEWLAHPALGQYQVSIEAASTSEDFAVILPRPLSPAGYWVRRVSADTARLLELAGICLAVALLASRSGLGAATTVTQASTSE